MNEGKTRKEIEDMLFELCEISNVGSNVNVPFTIGLWFFSEKVRRKVDERES